MLDVNKIINKNPSTAFAFAVWRLSYLIGILVGIYLSFITLKSHLAGFSLIKSLFLTAPFFIGWIAIWTLISSVVFALAYLAKATSRKSPILLFVFLPLPISFLTFFAYYFILLMDKEELAVLLFLIVLICGSFILIPINVIVWIYALFEYKRSIKESARPVNYKTQFILFLLLLAPFILTVVIFLKNRIPKDFHLPPKSTLTTAFYPETTSADDFIAIKSSEDTWQAIYKVQRLPNGESQLINLQTQQVVSIPLGSIDALATNFDRSRLFLFQRQDWLVSGIVLDRQTNTVQNIDQFNTYSTGTIDWIPLDNQRVFLDGIGIIDITGKLIPFPLKPISLELGEFSRWSDVICNIEPDKPPVSIDRQKFIGPTEEFRGMIDSAGFECLKSQAKDMVYIKEEEEDNFGHILFLGIARNISNEQTSFNYQVEGKAENLLTNRPFRKIVGIYKGKFPNPLPGTKIFSPNRKIYAVLSFAFKGGPFDYGVHVKYAAITFHTDQDIKIGSHVFNQNPNSVKIIGWLPEGNILLVEHNGKVVKLGP